MDEKHENSCVDKSAETNKSADMDNTTETNESVNRIKMVCLAGWHRISLVCLALASGILALLLWDCARFPALGTDGLIYHLTIPAQWLQNGLFSTQDLPFHDSAAEHSPMFSQLLTYCFMRWTGDDRLSWVVHPVFLLLLCYLYFRTLLAIELEKEHSLLLTASLLCFPPFLYSAQLPNNELVLASGCALFFYGIFTARSSLAGITWSSSGIALMLVSKVVGIVYSFVALIFLVPVAYKGWRECTKRRFLHAALSGCSILAGLSFYIRNWIEYGNPIYPADVSFLNIHLFSGLYDSSVLVDHDWQLSSIGSMLFHDTSMFAMTWVYGLLFWGSCAFLFVVVFTRYRQYIPHPDFAILFPVASSALYFATVPFWSEHRLLFPVYYSLWIVGAIAVKVVQKTTRESFHRYSFVLLILIFAYTLRAFGLYLLSGFGWVILISGLFFFIPRFTIKFVFSIFCAGVVIVSGIYPLQQRERLRDRMYEQCYQSQGKAWNMIEKYGSRRPLAIAYAGTAIIFPLYGSKLQNRVFYIPISPEDKPGKIILQRGDTVCQKLAQARRKKMDESFWLQKCQERQVEFLYLVDDENRGGVSPELAVVRKYKNKFYPIFIQDGVYLFYVKLDSNG